MIAINLIKTVIWLSFFYIEINWTLISQAQLICINIGTRKTFINNIYTSDFPEVFYYGKGTRSKGNEKNISSNRKKSSEKDCKYRDMANPSCTKPH